MADPENTISTGPNHAPSLWFTRHHQLITFPGWFGLSSGVTGQELGPLSSSIAWKTLPISKNVLELKTQGTFSTRRKSLPRMCLEVSNEGSFQKSPATVLKHPMGAWGDQVHESVGKTSYSGQGQLPLPSLREVSIQSPQNRTCGNCLPLYVLLCHTEYTVRRSLQLLLPLP